MLQSTVYNKVVSKQEKLFTFLVVLMAVANVYKLPNIPLGVGEIVLFISIPLYYKRGIDFSMHGFEKIFSLWFAYTLLSSISYIAYFDAPLSKFMSIGRVLFYYVIIFVFGKNLFDLNYFRKMMLVFAMALSCFIVLQFFVYTATGILIPGFLLNAPINNGDVTGAQLYEHYLNHAKYFGFVRPNGFLCEPAQCAQFLFISFVCVITDSKIVFMNKILLTSLFSIAVFLTTSTTGIVLLLFAWLVFVSIEKKLSVFRIPLVLIGLIFFTVLISGTVESGYNSFDRLVAVVNGSDIDGSSNTRLYNGFDKFSSLPFIFKIFGTGIGLFDYVFAINELDTTVKYMNAFSGIVFMSGVVGAVIWNVALFVMFRNSGILGRIQTCGFFIMCFGCSLFCQPQMVWIFLLALTDKKQKNDNRLLYVDNYM